MSDGFAEGFAVGQGNGNNGWANGGEWIWIIVLFALLGGGFGGGWNNGGSQMGYDLGKTATTNDVANGFTTSAIMGNQRELALTLSNMQNYINQGFSGLNVQLLNGFNGVERQISDCCCATQRAIDNVNFNMERNTCALKESIRGVTDWLTNEKIETLRDKYNQALNENRWLREDRARDCQTATLLSAYSRTNSCCDNNCC